MHVSVHGDVRSVDCNGGMQYGAAWGDVWQWNHVGIVCCNWCLAGEDVLMVHMEPQHHLHEFLPAKRPSPKTRTSNQPSAHAHPSAPHPQGRVRTKTIKKASRVIVEKHYARLTLDFDTNKRTVGEIASVPSKRLRNKIAGFTTVC